MQDDDELIGQRLGAFRILSLLGRGAVARVYRAHQASLDREVALKVICLTPGQSPISVTRFERERQIMEKLVHPNILPIFSFDRNSEYLWIAMRLMEGGTLLDRNFPPTQCLAILTQIADALDFAHGHGVLHRDIKPQNILLDEQAIPYLSDFGVAKMAEQEGLTAPGCCPGTPKYMTPELLQGKPLDARSDQYSLGVLAYYLLTGQTPFQGSMIDVMKAHVQSPPPDPRTHRPDLPEATAEVLLKVLSKNPTRRYDNIRQFVKRLEDSFAQQPQEQSQPHHWLLQPWEKARTWLRRGRSHL